MPLLGAAVEISTPARPNKTGSAWLLAHEDAEHGSQGVLG